MAKIELQDIHVSYPIYGESSFSLRRLLLHKTTGGRLYQNENIRMVHALQGITFSLERGDRLGLVGSNGAGKSTLLKTLGQFLTPMSGRMSIKGKVSILFDVCMGMDVDRSGYDNIFYMGSLLGMTRKKINAVIPDIETFSELGEFLSAPIRTYSSGMKVRLGFAISTCIEPEILLLDEAIGAGDKHFIDKAAERAKKLYDKAEILVLASHSSDILKEFCNKALWLDQGKIMMMGNVAEVVAAYEGYSK